MSDTTLNCLSLIAVLAELYFSIIVLVCVAAIICLLIHALNKNFKSPWLISSYFFGKMFPYAYILCDYRAAIYRQYLSTSKWISYKISGKHRSGKVIMSGKRFVQETFFLELFFWESDYPGIINICKPCYFKFLSLPDRYHWWATEAVRLPVYWFSHRWSISCRFGSVFSLK